MSGRCGNYVSSKPSLVDSVAKSLSTSPALVLRQGPLNEFFHASYPIKDPWTYIPVVSLPPLHDTIREELSWFL